MGMKRAAPKRKRRTKPTIWIGQYRFGARTIYAYTAANTRAECLALIEGGPFFDTVARKWTLTLTGKGKGAK